MNVEMKFMGGANENKRAMSDWRDAKWEEQGGWVRLSNPGSQTKFGDGL